MHSVVALYKGGRLPTWQHLPESERAGIEQVHVDQMLQTAQQHRLLRLEGFRLMAPQDNWHRFWIIEFPTLKGTAAWIDAEVAPPYGRYGYYEYDLARPVAPSYCRNWVTQSTSAVELLRGDPHRIPALDADRSSVVVVTFERAQPGDDQDVSVTDPYVQTMRSIAHEQGLMRLECFALIAPKAAWHRVWLAEFPTFEGAEAWIDAEVAPAHAFRGRRVFHLARKWAPWYFGSWST